MRAAAYFLADHAEVVNGKLYVNGGLITRLHRPAYPAPMDVSLVLVLENSREEARTTHQMEVRLQDADGTPLMPAIQGEMGIGSIPSDIPRGIPLFAPIALRIGVPIPRPGTYEFVLMLDQHHVASLPFSAEVGAPRPS